MVIGIIPARIGSTRLPGKMLADIGGKPLLWHTWNRAAKATRLDRLVIAAGDKTIAEAARGFGAEVVEAFDDVPSGSDRVYVAYQKIQLKGEGCGLQIDDSRALLRKSRIHDADINVVLNIQGDEPQIDPAAIDLAVEVLVADKEAGVGTVVAPITTYNEYIEPSVVKVVLDANNRALYFSRSPIPSGINADFNPVTTKLFRHMGLYAFRPEVLKTFTKLPQSRLEISERLEQLRLMEAGVRFAVGLVERAGMEVNTSEDLAVVRAAIPNLNSYLKRMI